MKEFKFCGVSYYFADSFTSGLKLQEFWYTPTIAFRDETVTAVDLSATAQKESYINPSYERKSFT